MKELTQQEFLKLRKKGNLIPVYKEILGDLLTPVGVYRKLAKDCKYSFLLESVEGQEKVARYSFISKNPIKVIRTKNKTAKIINFSSKQNPTISNASFDKTPLELVQHELDVIDPVLIDELPVFFGGYVGFLSYDTVRFFERLPDNTKDDLKVDDLVLMQADEVIVFDHLHHTIKIVSCVRTEAKDTQNDSIKKYKKAVKNINQIISQIRQADHLPTQSRSSKFKPTIKSNVTKKYFEDSVKKAKKQIKAGEIIQVVLSQRFETPIKTDPLSIYRSLRALNPSPYMFYLKLDDVILAGASPEMLVRCEDGLAETRPIAGTRPRGKTQRADLKYEQDLLNDPKEKAEHIMLVDLGRNDLGRVCKQGTVNVSEFMIIERYSHVMHIVSNVQGRLKSKDKGLLALQSTFPAGTLSGAPKIRAMEIIDDLETVRRGPYGGCIGVFGYSKNVDTCITIRTIMIKNKKAYVQAGAGIVADSKPAMEYQETINKAKAQLKAIEMAHQINL